MDIAVLGGKNTLIGLKLAGISKAVLAADSREELLEQFEGISHDSSLGILVVDNSCAKIRQDIARFVEANRLPMVVEIPGRGEKIEEGIIDIITKKATGAK